jgi:hypothetical protein
MPALGLVTGTAFFFAACMVVGEEGALAPFTFDGLKSVGITKGMALKGFEGDFMKDGPAVGMVLGPSFRVRLNPCGKGRS